MTRPTGLLVPSLGLAPSGFVTVKLVAAVTPFRYRDLLSIPKDTLITVFATSKIIIALPQLVENIKELFRRYGLGDEDVSHSAEILLPLAYPFPNLGTFTILMFIPFSAWYLGSSLDMSKQLVFYASAFLSSFVVPIIGIPLAYANEGFRDYTLLPIFPLRLFRHKSIFIRTGSGIKTPSDLRGRSVGTPAYSSTLLTWIRGILKDEYGVSPEEINWVLSNKDSSAGEVGKVSKQESVVPEGLNVRMGTTGLDESELLLNGEVDALFHGAAPQAYVEGNPKITRLFENSRDVELAYYRKTGIFPIMHAVAVRRALLEKHPEILKAIFEAYSKAKSKAYGYMVKMGWAADMLPWYGQELEHTVAAMGPNF